MNNKVMILLGILVGLITIMIVQSIYLNSILSPNQAAVDKKIQFVKIVALPDLAISTNRAYIRHRSLNSVASIYMNSPSLREYEPTTFAYAYTQDINNHPSKVINAKK